VAAVAPRIEADIGIPDVIVNNAGAGRHLFFEETDPSEFDEMMAAPFFAAVYVTRAFLPAMIKRGTGYIVTVNAPIAFVPWQGAAGYAAARWALRGLSEALRADLRGSGVNVGQVVAAKVASGYFEHNPGVEEQLPRIGQLAKTLSPDDVAGTIVRAIERERRFVVTPLTMAIMMRVAVHFPRLVTSVVQRTGVSRPDQT
jgi:short-subunit dehydrogenase